MSKIDLGRKLDDLISIEPINGDKTHYPTLHLDGGKELAGMPDTGEATIKYKIRNRTHREEKKDKGKEHSCSVTLDILSIDPPPAKSKKKDSDGGARKAFSDYWKDK